MKKFTLYSTLSITVLFLLISGCGSSYKERQPVKVKSPLTKFKNVLIKTSMGDIKVKLYWDAAPNTCLNFVKLAKKGFYKDIIFHRVIAKFMLQTGDPKGNGTGGPGYKFNDEIDADALGLDKIKIVNPRRHYHVIASIIRRKKISMSDRDKIKELVSKVKGWSVKKLYQEAGYIYTKGLKSKKAVRGALAMANSGPDTNGSQFFINVVDTSWLDGKHTVFGAITDGMKIVDKISNVPVDSKKKPKTDIKIIDIVLM